MKERKKERKKERGLKADFKKKTSDWEKDRKSKSKPYLGVDRHRGLNRQWKDNSGSIGREEIMV